MTQEIANRWWNKVANPTHVTGPCKMPKLCEVPRIFETLAPVVHANIDFSRTENEIWENICDLIVRMVKINPFPDPRKDFQLFVLYLYTFRELFGPTTIGNCMLYIQQMCPIPPADFFLGSFMLSVSTDLAIRTFYEMNIQSDKKWQEFIDQTGAVERLFDLLLPHLESDNNEDFVLHLAKLMTSLLMKRPDLCFWGRITSNFIKSLVELMEKTSPWVSVELARCLTQIGDKLIENSKVGKCMYMIGKLRNITQTSSPFSNYILSWICSKVTHLKDNTVMLSLTHDNNTDPFVFVIFEQMIRSVTPERIHTIVMFLSKAFISKWQWVRCAGSVLLKALQCDNCSDVTHKWFKRYLALCFMVIKLSWHVKKYRRRMLMWISVAAGPDFQAVDWIRYTTLENAQKSGCKWLSSFLQVNEFVEEKNWNVNYDRVKMYRSMLKTLPFKNQSLNLIKTHNLYARKQTKISAEVAALNLSMRLAPYVSFDEKQTLVDQLPNIFELEDELEEKKRPRRESRASCDMHPFNSHQRWRIGAALAVISDLECAAERRYRQMVENFTNEAQKLLGYMRQDHRIKVNVAKAMVHFEKESTFKPEYVRLKSQTALAKAYYAMLVGCFSNEISSLENYLNGAFIQATPGLCYCPPSAFDDLLLDRIPILVGNDVLFSMYTTVRERPATEAVSHVDKIAKTISKKLGISEHSEFVVYQALLRQALGDAYTAGATVLSKYERENTEFMRMCESHAQSKADTLKFKGNILTKMQRRRSIREVYANDMSSYSLDVLGFMTAPHDMAYTIHTNVGKLEIMLGLDHWLRSDVVWLLYGMIIAFPITNVVSICRFLKEWAPTFEAAELKEATACFIEAASMVTEICL